MKPIQNTLPPYTILYPIGTILRWINPKHPNGQTITVVGRIPCGNTDCTDCDRIQYVGTDRSGRCHYRSPESIHGLCYWEKVE